MKPRAQWASLLIGLALVLAALVVNLVGEETPVLGLDLQGGVSVILAPTESASEDDLIVIRDLIRDELENLGIAEPDVRVEGTNIVVDLPGVRDQREALSAVDVAGIVSLHPVVACGVEPETVGPGQAVLAVRGTDQICLVNASAGSGEVFARGSAAPTLEPPPVGWGVAVDLRPEGEAVWNAVAAQCFAGQPTCPSRQLAIVLDGVIQSAPQVNAPSFAGSVSITGSFTEDEARSLARILNRGAFPIGVEAQSVETVSPALGSDTLRAALISGVIGGLLIMVLMLAYYRRLGIVAVMGLVVWSAAMYSAVVFVSQSTNYALTLAGATGIIVAIGLAVDSYVVLFERIRDEQHVGRTMRNGVPRSFTRTARTIISANILSLLASLILFWLSVGSVRGFALYLGLTTITSLGVYFVIARPLVMILSRTRVLESRVERVSAAEVTS